MTLSEPSAVPARTWRTPTGIAFTALGAVSVGLGTVFQLKANDSAVEIQPGLRQRRGAAPGQIGTDRAVPQ